MPLVRQTQAPLLIHFQSISLKFVYMDANQQTHIDFACHQQIKLANRCMKCHCRLRKKWSEVKVAQSCLTLCNPMDYTVHGILQARIPEWVADPFSSGSSWPRNWTRVSCIVGGFFKQLGYEESPAVILEPKRIKSDTVYTVLSSICLWMPWSSLFECWVLSQLFHSSLSLSSGGSLVPLCFLP